MTEPTQIYRYLRTRNMISPIFLHRSLTFMGKRRSRQQSDKLRQDFKVDSLLKRKESEIRDSDSLSMNDRFMNLTFLGYYDKKSKTIFNSTLLNSNSFIAFFYCSGEEYRQS